MLDNPKNQMFEETITACVINVVLFWYGAKRQKITILQLQISIVLLKLMDMMKLSSVFITFLFCAINCSAQIVSIGTQAWSTANLDVTKFRNGDTIPQAKSKMEWEDAGRSRQPVWCYYNYDAQNGEKYGKLYNWYAVNDPRFLAPLGWHIPNSLEVQQLEDVYKLLPEDGTFLGRLNAFGFNAVMAGYITPTGESMNFKQFVAWWTSDPDQINSWAKFSFGWYEGADISSEVGKKYGFYVRCIKD